jgi:nicotinamidase-related amidase
MAPTSSHFPRSRSALLIVDVINPLDFEGAETLAPRAVRAVRRIAALAARARKARVPVIFVNDNRGRWRSHIGELIEAVEQEHAPGSGLLQILKPEKTDFVVLKSTLSGFYQTPLQAMLQLGNVKRVIVSGLVTGNCVLFTAADAYMRGYQVVIPSDGTTDETNEEHRDALSKMKDVLKAKVLPSARITLRR